MIKFEERLDYHVMTVQSDIASTEKLVEAMGLFGDVEADTCLLETADKIEVGIVFETIKDYYAGRFLLESGVCTPIPELEDDEESEEEIDVPLLWESKEDALYRE